MSPRRLSTERLVRHVLGELSGEEREETARAIADSRREGEREAQVRGMVETLGRAPAWTETVDLTAGVRAAIDREAAGDAAATSGAGRRDRRSFAARGWLVGGGAAAAAALVAVVLAGRERGATDGDPVRGAAPGSGELAASDVRPKGPSSRLDDLDRWVGIRLALARAGGDPHSITPGDRIGRGELQVSYTNLGPRPYSRLMVFAVDAAGQVRWLYPAYEREDTDPEAIEIEPAAADRLLPDRIESDLAAGRVVVCGVFSRERLTVKQVERALGGRAPAAGARLPLPGTGQHCFDLEAE